MKLLLKPLELLYRFVTRVKRALYREGLFEQRRLPRPVISVGNRSFGGSGKTPTVIAIARLLRERAFHVVILTRGYGREGLERFAVVDYPDSFRFGDEPVHIANSLPDIPVVVGADRYAAAQWYLTRGDCDLFLLDDGFQHLRLHRDCDVVIESPSAGLYREGRSALRDADIILLRDGARPAGGDKPSFVISLSIASVDRERSTGTLSSLKGQRVLAFAGLADNEQFFGSLKAAGAEIVETISFEDHHRYSPADEERILARASALDLLPVTTAKDRVKLVNDRFAVVNVEMTVDRPKELADTILRFVESRASR